MSLSTAVEWWQEWKLRILVLASMFIQYLLYFSLWLRKSPNLRRLRVLVWIAYIGGDAMAIYALAILFNRQKKMLDGGSSDLEVLWAPVLLIHLGGQPWISAYSLEDNELWKRHTITLVSQITVALYVFCKWWSGQKTLLAAAVLLFVVGILKFSLKPWALRTASFNNMQASISLLRTTQQIKDPLHEYSLEEHVQEAKKCALGTKPKIKHPPIPLTYFMFIDQSAPRSLRMKVMSDCVRAGYEDAYSMLQESLGIIFNRLYTRVTLFENGPSLIILAWAPFVSLASVVLFATSRKDGQNEKDISVTYILFCCTTSLELLILCLGFLWLVPCFRCFLENTGCDSFFERFRRWHNFVSQHNIMSFCAGKKKPTFLKKLATFNFLREFVHQQWYIQRVPIAYQITGVVRQHVEYGWKNYIDNAAIYKRFSELRGQWAVRGHHQLGWSLKKPFDESVLIWHIAIDLCFYHPNTSPQCREKEVTQRSRGISNYMIYLLLIRPEMLMPGTSSDLFTFASDQIFKNSKGLLDMIEEILAGEILNMPPSSDDMISNARLLAQQLMELGNEEERWTVIQGVWVEMLCYSASRCRGYLHAKSLGEGGEYLSYVWVLWVFMGMETLADRHQRSEPPQEEKKEAAATEEGSTSRSQGRADQSEHNISRV